MDIIYLVILDSAVELKLANHKDLIFLNTGDLSYKTVFDRLLLLLRCILVSTTLEW